MATKSSCGYQSFFDRRKPTRKLKSGWLLEIVLLSSTDIMAKESNNIQMAFVSSNAHGLPSSMEYVINVPTKPSK